MALFDDRLQRAADADAVAAHDHQLALFLIVGVGRAVLLAVFRAELEHVANLDRAADLERLARLWTGFADAHPAKVAILRDREIARHVDLAQMVTVFVRAGNAVADQAHGVVGKNAGQCVGVLDRAAHCAQTARFRAHDGLDFLHGGGTPEAEAERAELGLLEFVPAAEHDREESAVAHEDQRLELPVGRHAVGRRLEGGNRGHTGGGKFLERAFRRGIDEIRRHEAAGGLFPVGRVAALLAADNIVVADLGRHHELVRETAAHHPGVGLDRDRLQAAPREEFRVGRLHREIAADRGLVVDVK